MIVGTALRLVAFVAFGWIIWPLQIGLRRLAEMPWVTLLAAAVGLILGLVTAALLTVPLANLDGLPRVWVPIGLTIALACLGVALMVSRQRDLAQFLPDLHRGHVGGRARAQRNGQILVDTSALIDGRIADISQTGFVTGTMVIPRFILDELRHIADSHDSLRRNRGRRGLEMLNRIRKEANIPIQILDVDIRDGLEVDGKLVQLAKNLQAPIFTTDFNLNRVAEIQEVQVLNINELANALKPVVLPGEEMNVRVLQEGREAGQGVAFLDDGTMVVVENGRRYINQHIDVTITRVLQTAAGRLIFAQPKV